jgi:O-antigen/teichoic acid export membrane protein
VLGTNLYIVREVAADRQRLSGLVTAGLVLRAPLWALFALAISLYLVARGTARDALLVMGALFLVTLANVLNGVLASALQGLEEMRWRSVSAIGTSLAVLVVGLPVLMLTRSPVWFCVALLLGALVGLGINAYYFVNRRVRLTWPSATTYRSLGIGAMPFLALAVSQGLYSQIDTIFTGLLTNEATVGWFAAAARLGTAVLLVPVVMTSALFPVMSRLISTEPSAAYESMRRTLLTVLLIAMPLACGLAAIGSPLFHFLHYPSPFSHSVPILAVMCLCWILTAVVMVLGCGAMASGGQRTWALASIALLVVFAVSNLVLIPLAQLWWANGGIGAALANVLGELALVVVGLMLMPSRLFGLRDVSYVGRIVLACLLMTAVVRASSGLWLPLSIAAGGVAYGISSVALRTLKVEDVKAVVRLLKSRVSTEAPETTGQTPSTERTIGVVAAEQVPG